VYGLAGVAILCTRGTSECTHVLAVHGHGMCKSELTGTWRALVKEHHLFSILIFEVPTRLVPV
jgi:hypothetical protein